MGVLQARILGWVAMPFSRGSSQTKDQTLVPRIAGRFLTILATGETHNKRSHCNEKPTHHNLGVSPACCN